MNSLFWYCFTGSAGILLSAALYVLRLRKSGLSVGRGMAGFLIGLPAAYLFAKFVYVAFNYFYLNDMYGFGKWFRLVPAEFSFMGGCVGFCLGVILPWIRQRKQIPVILDRWALPGCLLVGFLRFAEIFLESTGLAELSVTGLSDIEEGSLLACFPFAVSDSWGMWYFAVSTLSALIILLIGLMLILREKKNDALPPEAAGIHFAWTASLLCVQRIFLELMRMESMIFYFVHVEQVLSALVLLGMLIRMCRRRKKQTGKIPVGSLAAFLLCLIVNGLTQYMLDKPWKFEALMTEGMFEWVNGHLSAVCFSIFLLTSLLIAVIFLILDRRIRDGYLGKTQHA